MSETSSLHRHTSGAVDPRGFTDLLAVSLPRLRRYLSRRAGPSLLSQEAVSDLLQSVCLAMVKRRRHWRGKDGKRGFRAWIERVAEYKMADRGRRNRAMVRDSKRVASQEQADNVLSAIEQNELQPNLAAELSEDLERLDDALDLVPEQDRVLIIRLRLNGEAPDVVAASLGITKQTMRVQLHRALAKLSIGMERERTQ